MRFCELGVSRLNSVVHERFLYCASVRHSWAPENAFAGDPSSEHLPGETINWHAYHMADPSKQPGLVVPPELPHTNLAQEGVHADASSSGVAKVHTAHCANAVMVKPLKFLELTLSQTPALTTIEQHPENESDVDSPFHLRLDIFVTEG